jgi:hypothetical protein
MSETTQIVLKISIAIVYLLSTAYLLYYLVEAIQTVPLGKGFQNILSNPWATSALVDYVTGLVLGIPYLFAQSQNVILAIIWSFSLFFLGIQLLY